MRKMIGTSVLLLALLASGCAGSRRVIRLDGLSERDAARRLAGAPDRQLFELGGRRTTAAEARAVRERQRAAHAAELRQVAAFPRHDAAPALREELDDAGRVERAEGRQAVHRELELRRRSVPARPPLTTPEVAAIRREAEALMARFAAGPESERAAAERRAQVLLERLRALGFPVDRE